MKKRFSIPGIKTINVPPLSRIAILFSLSLILALLISCKKDTKKPENPAPSLSGLDTGSNAIGATRAEKMFTYTDINMSFYTSAPLNLSNVHDTVINGISTTRITLFACQNITIKNCKIGPNTKSGISIENCTNITIDSCYIFKVSTGVYAGDSETIKVVNCQGLNMLGPYPEGQFVQFNNVRGGGNKISYNKFENIPGESNTEDAISIYGCNGLPNDLIVVESNWIRGGGPSKAGGGVMLGDGTGSYMVAKKQFPGRCRAIRHGCVGRTSCVNS